MGWLKIWWGKYKRKLGERASELPKDIEAFIDYMDQLNINLQSKQEIVRFVVKVQLGVDFKHSKRNVKKLRRAMRFYESFESKRAPQPAVEALAT